MASRADSLRVVLYAEGAGETGGERTLLPAPGSPLPEASLGPAHFLTRRALVKARELNETEVRFDSPIRAKRGRTARGSDLHNPATLYQLLSWAKPELQPDLAIVLIDQDGDKSRRNLLKNVKPKLLLPAVLAIAIQEFEAWLIADAGALAAVTSPRGDTPPRPESMKRGEAKDRLSVRLAKETRSRRALRAEIASTCDLRVVADRCASFSRFLRDLKAPDRRG